MIAERQFSNFSASLNPFNSIPQVQPTATQAQTQTLLPAISVPGTETLMPLETTTAIAPLPTNTYYGDAPSETMAELSSIFLGYPPAVYTETDSLPPRPTATSLGGAFTGLFGSPSSMAFESSVEQSVLPTVTVFSIIPGPSNTVTVSLRQSDVARASSRASTTKSTKLTQSTKSTRTSGLVTTSTSFTTISPSSTSESSSSSEMESSSTITSMPAARATSTNPDMSNQHKPSLSSAAIAGITFASAASLALLAFLLFFCLRRRRTHKPPSIYPEEAYLYDPPITPPSEMPPYVQSAQPWMRGDTAYHPTTQIPPNALYGPPANSYSPHAMSTSPPMRAVTPDGYERVGLLGVSEEEQDMGLMGSWPLRGRNSVSYRPLGTGRGYRLPPLHEDLHESIDHDPRNPFGDEHV